MKRRFLVFLLLFPALTLPTFGYLGWRLCSGPRDWALLALPFLSVLSFPLQIRLRSAGRAAGLAAKVFSQLTYVSMALVSFLLVSTLARDLLGAITGKLAGPGFTIALAVAMLIGGSASGFFGPRLRRRRLVLASLPEVLRGLRIAQVSDLHLSAHVGRRYTARVARKILLAAPDLIVFTGDIGDGHVAELSAAIETLRPLAKSAPVFYVPGNHEVYWNLEEWLGVFRGLGMRVLLNEGAMLRLRGENIFVGDITDPACAAAGLPPDLAAATKSSAGAALKILLSHRPDPAEEAAAAGYDLQLSGHTHGGQFFPWTLVAAYVHKYSLGLYRVGKMWIYVSAGTGSWGPRVRLGTQAEVTLFELLPS